MVDIRVTVGGVGQSRMSHTPGDRVGLQVNTFGMDRLIEGLTGDMLVPILVEGIQPAYFQLLATWPILTGASRDSAEVVVTEVGARFARVALLIGGPKLISDPRNKSGKDYTPFVEFNGTPKTPAGTLLNAMIDNQPEMRDYIHKQVGDLIRELVRA